MRIEVKEATVNQKSGNTNGKAWLIREQAAWVHLGKPYPVEVKVRLADDQAPFPVGEYAVTDACYWVDRWGKVMVDLAHMQPVKGAVRAA
jgi:hypothetical protein